MGDQNTTPAPGAAGAPGADLNKGAAGASTGVTEEELKKSLDGLDSIVRSTPEGRKAELFQKGAAGTLTSAETTELSNLMAGAQPDGLAKSVTGLTDPNAQSADFQKSLNVSGYLEDLHKSVTAALGAVATHVDRSDARTQEQVMVLAKGLYDIGRVAAESRELVKSLQASLDQVLRQPGRAPKSVAAVGASGVQPMEKSFAGAPAGGGQGDVLTKSQIQDYLFEMSMAAPEGLSKSGERFDYAISAYEQSSVLSKAMEAEVINYHRARRAQNGAAR